MLIIGIAGGSGSGKTTVVKAITERLKDRVVVIPQDSYYKDLSHLTEQEKRDHNFDHPDSIDFDLLCHQLKELKEGKTIEQPIYSYITCGRSKDETLTVKPADVIIVEGILIYTCAKLRRQTYEGHVKRHSGTRQDSGLGDRTLHKDCKADVSPVHRAEQALRRHHNPSGRSQPGGY